MKHITGLLFLLIFISCKDQPEQIPGYLKVEKFTVSAQGDSSWHKITEGWIYVNGEYLGAYTLPALIPILAEGQSEVWLYPGVKENGILASPNIYPILTRWESKTVEITPGQTTTIYPSTTYDPATVYSFGIGRGDFDGGSSIVLENRDNDDITTFSITTDGAFAGKCMLMELDTAHPLIEVATEKVSGLPISGSPETWLEMHYTCNVPFYLFLLYTDGLTSAEQSQAVFQFNPSENWNKIYLNLTQSLTLSQGEEYRLYIRCPLPKDENGAFSTSTGTVRVDNIRLLHL